jgi:DNA invertase Pin-like site-specific DNA recombinase
MFMKAALWIRVSTGHQTGKNQLPELEKFAEHHGYELVERYQVSESAWNGGKVRISVIPYTQFGVFEREVSEAA